MHTHWDTCLLYLGTILLIPKMNSDSFNRALLPLAVIVTVIGVLWVRTTYMMNFVQLIPVMICVFRLVKWRLHVKSWVTGFLIVLFVFRCKEFYPFSHWHNVQCDVIAAWLIGLLVHFFAADSNDIPTIWSLVYLSSIVLERIFNGHFDLNVTLYWKTEAILLALVFLREGLVTRFVKRSETIV